MSFKISTLSDADAFRLSRSYVELLKINNAGLRIQIQSTYCWMRDALAIHYGKSQQEIQEKYEEIAIKEKYMLYNS